MNVGMATPQIAANTTIPTFWDNHSPPPKLMPAMYDKGPHTAPITPANAYLSFIQDIDEFNVVARMAHNPHIQIGDIPGKGQDSSNLSSSDWIRSVSALTPYIITLNIRVISFEGVSEQDIYKII